MSSWRRRGARLLAEIRFILGGAVTWGAAGFAVGLAVAWKTGASDSLAWVTTVSRGFAFGWWGGALWCTLLALTSRRGVQAPPLARLTRATWIGAAVAAAGTVAAVLLGQPLLGGALLATAAATVAARMVASRA